MKLRHQTSDFSPRFIHHTSDISAAKVQRIFEIRKKKKDLILQKISQKTSFIK